MVRARLQSSIRRYTTRSLIATGSTSSEVAHVEDSVDEPSKFALNTPPLAIDRLMAGRMPDLLGPPAANLDFSGIWTSWRDALPLPGVAIREAKRSKGLAA